MLLGYVFCELVSNCWLVCCRCCVCSRKMSSLSLDGQVEQCRVGWTAGSEDERDEQNSSTQSWCSARSHWREGKLCRKTTRDQHRVSTSMIHKENNNQQTKEILIRITQTDRTGREVHSHRPETDNNSLGAKTRTHNPENQANIHKAKKSDQWTRGSVSAGRREPVWTGHGYVQSG